MSASRRTLLLIGLVVLLQTSVLAVMVADRVRLITFGREISLPIIPVDPRDIFRGEYVRLGYEVGQVPLNLLEGSRPRRNAPFFVTLEKQPDGAWRPIRMSRTRPRESSPDRIVLKAR